MNGLLKGAMAFQRAMLSIFCFSQSKLKNNWSHTSSKETQNATHARHAETLLSYKRLLASMAMTRAADETCVSNGSFCSVVCSAGIDTLEFKMKLLQ